MEKIFQQTKFTIHTDNPLFSFLYNFSRRTHKNIIQPKMNKKVLNLENISPHFHYKTRSREVPPPRSTRGTTRRCDRKRKCCKINKLPRSQLRPGCSCIPEVRATGEINHSQNTGVIIYISFYLFLPGGARERRAAFILAAGGNGT